MPSYFVAGSMIRMRMVVLGCVPSAATMTKISLPPTRLIRSVVDLSYSLTHPPIFMLHLSYDRGFPPPVAVYASLSYSHLEDYLPVTILSLLDMRDSPHLTLKIE